MSNGGKPDTAVIDWGQVATEPVDEEDMTNAEDMGRVPIGRYACTCVESTCIRKYFKQYDAPCAHLKWRVDRAIELEGKPVPENEQENLAGRHIFDDVALFSPKEKEGMRNRRIFVAKRTGLIDKTTTEITSEMWATGIIGKQAILNFVDDSYEDKAGVMKKFRKVAFDGYDYLENVSAPGSKKQDGFDDI